MLGTVQFPAMNSIRRDFDSSNNKLKPSKYNELMSWHEKMLLL